MISATLNTRVLVQKETTSINAVGTPVEEYADLYYPYASIKFSKGGTEFDEGAAPFTYTEFIIRYDSRINYKCRIKHEDEYYKILHIEPLGGRKEAHRLKTVKWDE